MKKWESKVMKWVEENFNLDEVIVENHDHLPCGKKVTDDRNDYVICFYDEERERLNYLFKDK